MGTLGDEVSDVDKKVFRGVVGNFSQERSERIIIGSRNLSNQGNSNRTVIHSQELVVHPMNVADKYDSFTRDFGVDVR
jgi:hypothetical protein